MSRVSGDDPVAAKDYVNKQTLENTLEATRGFAVTDISGWENAVSSTSGTVTVSVTKEWRDDAIYMLQFVGSVYFGRANVMVALAATQRNVSALLGTSPDTVVMEFAMPNILTILTLQNGEPSGAWPILRIYELLPK